ncbi:MAG TPA: ATP-binding protein [Methanosarcina sp.]|nr:ATP-binding protein [Methanosarcina sp.]
MRKNIDKYSGFFSREPQISAVYDNLEELTELLVIYFKQGIERGEYCLWISPNKLTVEEAKNELKKVGVDVDYCLESSQLEIIPVDSLQGNADTPVSTVKELTEKRYKKALLSGFSGFRTNFDFSNAGSSLKGDFDKCGKIVETLVFEKGNNVTILCTLPLKELSGKLLLELMEEKDLFAKKEGEWTLLGQLEGQKELEETLLKAKKDVEAVNRAKNVFIMNMSHELRTPLNSVIGFSDLLLEGAFGPMNTKQSKYVNNILVSGKNLLEIINNLLDISRLEAGEKNLDYEEVDIPSLIGEVRMSLFSFASSKKINIELKVDASLGSIQADRSKLRQILYNLMSNAIKFTPKKGNIIVSACKKEGILEVKISDNGIGLSKADLEKIFMPFTQADLSSTKGYSGTGLGLYIVKNFIDLHRGKIFVDSEIGKGSVFTFTLPVDKKGEALTRKKTKKENLLS